MFTSIVLSAAMLGATAHPVHHHHHTGVVVHAGANHTITAGASQAVKNEIKQAEADLKAGNVAQAKADLKKAETLAGKKK